jgi:hypothetical protein
LPRRAAQNFHARFPLVGHFGDQNNNIDNSLPQNVECRSPFSTENGPARQRSERVRKFGGVLGIRVQNENGVHRIFPE